MDARRSAGRIAALLCTALLLAARAASAQPFVTFESGQVRPLALSPDGARLYAVNTPDGRLAIFDVDTGGLAPAGSLPVGLEPVAVAARSNTEVWVVNHLSDSVSIVDVGSSPPRVVRTLLVGDEPRDIVFAGADRAFITCAHRGQNNPNDPQLTTEGVGRADVWVFDATDLGTSLGGDPVTIVTLFGDTPRALAVSPDGNTVYAAVFHSGNQTTTLTEPLVCNGGASAAPCTVDGFTMPGGLPAPNTNFQGRAAPETGLIVRWNPTSGHWEDGPGRNWDGALRFSLPDLDVFAIDATANPPVETAAFAGVGTVLFNMAVNPVSGKVYVTNTEAHNEVRFEGPGVFGGSTVRGHLHEARITVLDGATVTPRHLNKHIVYTTVPSPAGVKEKSLATPVGMAVTADGSTLYVAAFGSSTVGVFDTTALENDTFVPSTANHFTVSGGGPSGLVLDETNARLYVMTRFDNAVSVLSTASGVEEAHLALHNPEPASVVNGRPFLYDALATSSNGEAACAACHVFGDFDSLAWDLGNPDDIVTTNPNPSPDLPFLPPVAGTDFHPMKGPMTTQTLRGMANNGPMHWRGDRTGGSDPGGDPLDEDAAFKKFNVAFGGLLGRGGPLTASEMQAFTNFVLQVTLPPNPIRSLDNSLTPAEQAGRNLFFGRITDTVANCDGCHVTGGPSFGTSGLSTFEGEPQFFKVPHLRNLYEKVGMFGMPAVPGIRVGDNGFLGPQVRGFGFLHDGSIDTLFRFHGGTVFSVNDTERAQLEAFMLAFDSNLAPIVGQQITVTPANGATVASRVTLLLQRAGASECDVVVKGNLGGEARGWVRTAAGTFRSDRASESLVSETTLRGQASVAGQERTYTCVPPGSGQRIGVDRDQDGSFDRDELDAGSDPEDPTSIPPGATTTTTFGTSTTTSTTTTLPPIVLAQSTTMKLTDPNASPITTRKFIFKSSTKGQPAANRIVPPPRGSAGDPTLINPALVIYNSAGTGERAVQSVPRSGWSYIGSSSNPKGYKYSGRQSGLFQIKSIKLTADHLTIKGSNIDFSLDEQSQVRMTVLLGLGATGVCAEAPARLSGNPPSSALNDRPGRFIGQPKAPPPPICPPIPP